MKLSLGFSPCPNDTFIFDALIHHKIDTEGLDFEIVMDDVENLNKKAFDQTLDIDNEIKLCRLWFFERILCFIQFRKCLRQ